jgi:hypothetical protein
MNHTSLDIYSNHLKMQDSELYLLSHFIVKELGNDLSSRYVLFLELRQTMRL